MSLRDEVTVDHEDAIIASRALLGWVREVRGIIGRRTAAGSWSAEYHKHADACERVAQALDPEGKAPDAAD